MTPDDGGYVHDPAAFDEAGERAEGDDGEAGADLGPGGAGDRDGPVHPATVDREFGRRGWILVAAIVVALIVAPILILVRPPQLPYYVALLILPLFPAVLLAVVAVWATTRP